ncbi:MAG TPA: nicotinate-nicotinamide nucleotide adenylyltransferase [Gaiellaceae bacterium]|jgi:nicotinate-nucleotide adenylyltransferase|nr:nicotinate-nicotinamide nucleotide adenylyltransferase [Gaiellaceae bacterium]
MTLGLFGGAFDPPHRGHVQLARSAKELLGLERLLVLVAADPGHKAVGTPGQLRLEMAQAAFPDDEVVLDDHARTIDLLRDHPEWQDAWFVIGADEFCDFLSWKEPNEVLARVRLAVGTRPGFPRGRPEQVLAGLEQPERVLLFDMEPVEAASRQLRRALVDADVPPAVAEIIRREGLYRSSSGVH